MNRITDAQMKKLSLAVCAARFAGEKFREQVRLAEQMDRDTAYVKVKIVDLDDLEMLPEMN